MDRDLNIQPEPPAAQAPDSREPHNGNPPGDLEGANDAPLITIEGPGPLDPLPGPIDWSRPLRIKGGGNYPVRIIAIDHSLSRPVIGVILGTTLSLSTRVSEWCFNGQYDPSTPGTCLDLENVPEARV